MLESLRRSGASIFIYLIFGLLIAIFVAVVVAPFVTAVHLARRAQRPAAAG